MKFLKTISLLALGFILGFGLFISQPEEVDARIYWNGGEYTNLCGTGYSANAYTCAASCNPNNGSCSGCGNCVVKWTCGGRQTECTSGESGWSGYHQFDNLNNQTQQIDVFNHYCRDTGGWSCGPTDLTGYMVWYHPSLCTNNCNTSDPNRPNLQSPNNGAVLSNNNVNFNWSQSGWGGCGGNSCTSSCNATTPGSFRITINGVGTFNTGTSSNYSRTLSGGTYTWYVTVTNACGRTRTSQTRSFTINNPPTVNGNITSNDVCLGSGPTGLSGIYGEGVNNPLITNVTYRDIDGRNDLRYLRAWVSNTSLGNPSNSKIYGAAYGTIYHNNGSYQLQAEPGGQRAQLTGTAAVCTYGTNQQSICDINNLGNATAFARPVVTGTTSNTISVRWEMGLLNESTFNGAQRFRVYTSDRFGAQDGWNNSGNWTADLVPPTRSVNHTLTSENTFNVSYTASDSGSGIISTSKSCSAQVNSLNNFTLSQTNPADSPSLTFTPAGNNYSICINNDPGTIGYEVDRFPTDGSLSFQWTARDGACNEASADSTSIRLLPPWLITTDGDTFSRDGYIQTNLINIQQPILNTFLMDLSVYNNLPHLSDYNLIQEASNAPESTRDSVRDYRLYQYNDSNGTPPDSLGYPDWFTFLENRIDENFSGIRETIPGQTFTNMNTSQIGSGVPVGGPAGVTVSDRVNVIETAENNGDLVLNRVRCNTKTIFIVNGNLTIIPDAQITGEPTVPQSGLQQNGCMYIVSGTTTVEPGQNKSRPNVTTAPYDLVDAFIITNSFITTEDTNRDGLRLRGSVVTNQGNSFERDNGVVLNQFAPSEIFEYDGGRYIELFADIITMPLEFNIQEKQFIESLRDS